MLKGVFIGGGLSFGLSCHCPRCCMEALLRDRLPHAPQMGLFVAPNIPAGKLDAALSDYATEVERDAVLALYDATLSGTGGDGAVFARDRFVFQNNDLQAAQTVRYADLVGVEAQRRWLGLGGKRVALTVNRGRATFELTMDFSGAPEAADYVADVLDAAMVRDVDFGPATPADETDTAAVRDALQRLRAEQKLTEEDFARLLSALQEE